MTTITKVIDIEIDDIKDRDLFEELESRIASKYLLFTKEHQEKMMPEIDKQLKKLEEIYTWLTEYE